jgi:hypothetical protein
MKKLITLLLTVGTFFPCAANAEIDVGDTVYIWTLDASPLWGMRTHFYAQASVEVIKGDKARIYITAESCLKTVWRKVTCGTDPDSNEPYHIGMYYWVDVSKLSSWPW